MKKLLVQYSHHRNGYSDEQPISASNSRVFWRTIPLALNIAPAPYPALPIPDYSYICGHNMSHSWPRVGSNGDAAMYQPH